MPRPFVLVLVLLAAPLWPRGTGGTPTPMIAARAATTRAAIDAAMR